MSSASEDDAAYTSSSDRAYLAGKTERTGRRRMPLGENTTSGLRYSRTSWRRRRWKYCAAVVTLMRCMLGTKGVRLIGSLVSWRNRSMRALSR